MTRELRSCGGHDVLGGLGVDSRKSSTRKNTSPRTSTSFGTGYSSVPVSTSGTSFKVRTLRV
ncbi:hypothetical protein ACFQ1S_07585, partial [Kibdelosporangium lantanae]